jgi:hypothetical protein
MLGEHSHVIDQVGEQRGHDAPVADVDRRMSFGGRCCLA